MSNSAGARDWVRHATRHTDGLPRRTAITARVALLARQPYIGRRRDEDLRPGVRSFVVGDYVIAYRVDGDNVLILRVLRGSRDIEALFRDWLRGR